MNLSLKTKRFISSYVLPFNKNLKLVKENIGDLIEYITNTYERPMSKQIANGEMIDYDLFSEVNLVLNELSSNR